MEELRLTKKEAIEQIIYLSGDSYKAKRKDVEIVLEGKCTYICNVDDAFSDGYGYLFARLKDGFVLFPLDEKKMIDIEKTKRITFEDFPEWFVARNKYKEKIELYKKYRETLQMMETSLEAMEELFRSFGF